MAKSTIYTPSHEREADCYKVHDLLCAPDAKKAFGNDRWFSASSSADVFDMRGTCGGTELLNSKIFGAYINTKEVMRYNLGDRQILAMLEACLPNPTTTQSLEFINLILHMMSRKRPGQTRKRRYRRGFIDEVQGDLDRLKCTSELLQAIFQTYCISSRVARLLERQHMPGRVVQYDPITQKPIHHQFWYSTILRLNESITSLDSSKSVLGWKRLCVWVGRNLFAGTTIMLVLRCPKDMRAELISSFSDKGEVVMRQPMLLHAFFAQNSLQKADKFTETWADPIYEWEQKVDDNGSTSVFTARTRVFLTLARQITQVATDYEILGPALHHLKTEYEWIAAQSNDDHLEMDNSSAGVDNSELKDVWDVYISELQLLKAYAKLYETRTQLAINECFAMVNQRDAELNIQMARESTQIARSSRDDGRSLRTIQILTMIFLPASLFSGIFGMGFFNTDTDDNGNIRFSVSSNWWWYPALTIPMTAVTMLTLVGRKLGEKWKTNKRATGHFQNPGVGC
ncbi:uncharacterized protein H6S33_006606 [Morchella sextelata]|uniref:uncharacterized protein n=1 Tax=Morchella sextelata TaxID=1174677 RepID=UPI001D043EBF|nr:uncharacterized protein H6S33_006606 [Morchella sextelata]KAH0604229.1 hypothetical protein H6S33_006606 [Morchella sextelata]